MTAVADDVLAETRAFNAELERQLAANPATTRDAGRAGAPPAAGGRRHLPAADVPARARAGPRRSRAARARSGCG